MTTIATIVTIAASAPGKVLIAGEYAVLGGGPAISMAIDRRAVVRVADASSSGNALHVKGYADGCWAFRSSRNGDIEWADPPPLPGAFRLFECLWRSAGMGARETVSVSLDTSAFFDDDTGRKYGLGSSAALSVAAGAVLGGDQSSDARIAAAAHREFQGGAGSGFDIATSRTGGVIRYRRDALPEPLPWPDGLKFRLLWSGRSADTRDRLSRLGDEPIDAYLLSAAQRVADVWTAADAGQIVEAIAAFAARLASFDLDRELGIFEAGHRRLADAAARAGIVYKPCGAGGGDIGIVLGSDDEALDAFAADAAVEGFRVLDAAIDPAGLVVEGPHSDD